MPKGTRNNAAFTLVELSIVIIIVGLIVSSAMVGRNLLTHSRLLAVISENNTFQEAVQSFRTRYSSLPGDFSYASTEIGSPASIDGNSNGYIEYVNSNDVAEGVNAWKHLAIGEFIAMNPEVTGFNPPHDPGVDVPELTYNRSAGYYFNNSAILNGTGNDWPYPPEDLKNMILVGTQTGNTNALILNGSFSMRDVVSIDSKADDGVLRTGFIRAGTGDNANDAQCHTSTTNEAAINGAIRDFPDPRYCYLAFSIEE